MRPAKGLLRTPEELRQVSVVATKSLLASTDRMQYRTEKHSISSSQPARRASKYNLRASAHWPHLGHRLGRKGANSSQAGLRFARFLSANLCQGQDVSVV